METGYCDVLNFAIELEKKGEKLYRDLAEKVINDISIKTLNFLADEERHHIEKIEKFNQALTGEGKFEVETECRSTFSNRLSSFLKDFTEKKAKEVKMSDSDIDVYGVALEVERASYDLYKDAYNKSENENLKKFFKFLMGEEEKHYALLEASKKYVEDPSYYFEELGGEIFG